MTRVLFVDIRNTARSPMAEAWFNYLTGRRVARAWSCGTMPSSKIDPVAVQAMREVRLNLRHHTPRMITQQYLADADWIILMGREINPYAFRPTLIWNFSDPTGEPLERYRELRDTIRLNVLKLIAEIDRVTAEPRQAEAPSAR